MSIVFSVSKSKTHEFSKDQTDSIYLIEGEGVKGDAHCGVTVKHRSRVKKDPTQPNLRQVHLIHHELIEQLQNQGFHVHAATMGENITTSGIDLLSLPTNSVLILGGEAQIRITGLRNPCKQLDHYQDGLTAAVLDKDEQGQLIRKAGVMGVVIKQGHVKTGDTIEVVLPQSTHQPLECV